MNKNMSSIGTDLLMGDKANHRKEHDDLLGKVSDGVLKHETIIL